MHNARKTFTGRCRLQFGLIVLTCLAGPGVLQAAADATPISGSSMSDANRPIHAAPSVSPEDIHRLILQLGAPRYAVREAAQAQLTEIGPPAWSDLEKAARSTEPEVQRRASDILLAIRSGMAARSDGELRRRVLWQFQVGRPVGSITSCRNKIIFGAAGEGVYALSAETGKKVWTFETADYLSSFPLMHGGNVLFSSMNRGLFACNTETGRQEWMYAPPFSLRRTCQDANAIYVVAGAAVTTDSIGSLVALDAATGRELWQSELRERIVSQPVLAGDKVFVNAEEHSVVALCTRNGKIAWTWDANGVVIGSPVESSGLLYVLTASAVEKSSGSLCAIEADSGKVRWVRGFPMVRKVTLSEKSPTAVVHLNAVDYVVSGVHEGKLYIPACGEMLVFDARTGQEEWRFDTLAAQLAERAAFGEWAENTPPALVIKPPLVIHDGAAYMGGPDGVYAIDLKTRRQLWKFHTSQPVTYRMAQADGVLFFASAASLNDIAMEYTSSGQACDIAVPLYHRDYAVLENSKVKVNIRRGDGNLASTIYALKLPSAASNKPGSSPAPPVRAEVK